MGGAFSPDGDTFYYGSADEGRIVILDVATLSVTGAIDLNADGFVDSFVGDLALSRDGRRLLAVDQFNYRLAIVDVDSRASCGRSASGATRLRSRSRPTSGPRGSRTSACSSTRSCRASRTRRACGGGAAVSGVRRTVQGGGGGHDGRVREVPGLGSPNHPDAMSVFKVDLETGRVTARIKTGLPRWRRSRRHHHGRRREPGRGRRRLALRLRRERHQRHHLDHRAGNRQRRRPDRAEPARTRAAARGAAVRHGADARTKRGSTSRARA